MISCRRTDRIRKATTAILTANNTELAFAAARRNKPLQRTGPRTFVSRETGTRQIAAAPAPPRNGRQRTIILQIIHVPAGLVVHTETFPKGVRGHSRHIRLARNWPHEGHPRTPAPFVFMGRRNAPGRDDYLSDRESAMRICAAIKIPNILDQKSPVKMCARPSATDAQSPKRMRSVQLRCSSCGNPAAQRQNCWYLKTGVQKGTNIGT